MRYELDLDFQDLLEIKNHISDNDQIDTILDNLETELSQQMIKALDKTNLEILYDYLDAMLETHNEDFCINFVHSLKQTASSILYSNDM